MLPSFANKTVAVTRAPLVESRGTKMRDWANAVTHELSGVSVQPVSTELNLDARENVRIDAVMYCPEDSDIEAADRVTYRNRDYTVIGSPMLWESPTGAVSHVQVELAAWYG